MKVNTRLAVIGASLLALGGGGLAAFTSALPAGGQTTPAPSRVTSQARTTPPARTRRRSAGRPRRPEQRERQPNLTPHAGPSSRSPFVRAGGHGRPQGMASES